MYIYQADTYCDVCGDAICRMLDREGKSPADPSDEYSFDSDDYPKWAPEGETDSPDHCASEHCLEPVRLSDYGLTPDSPMYGAEKPCVGALLSDGLTEYGIACLREMLDNAQPTPYQVALHNYWREVFADELSDSEG